MAVARRGSLRSTYFSYRLLQKRQKRQSREKKNSNRAVSTPRTTTIRKSESSSDDNNIYHHYFHWNFFIFSTMATKFSDIVKAPKDLLNDDYGTKTTLKCKKGAGPVAVTIETERGEGGALSSKIGTKFSYAKFNVDKAQATANGGHVFESSLKVAPNVKLSFKANKGADVGIDYTSGNFYGTGVLDVAEMSKISTSACVGLASGIKAGGDATYALAGKSGLTGLNVGASYSSGPLFAGLTSASKFSQFNLSLLYKVNDDLSVASVTTHASDKICDVGGVGCAYKANFGTVKAKYSGSGVVSGALIKEIEKGVTLTASGTVSLSDFSTFKYGLGITM